MVVVFASLVAVLAALMAGEQDPSRYAPVAVTSSTAGYNWYKTDTHVHSTVSADAFSDIGIHAAAGKAQGYNAMFLTDHHNASNFLINNLSANHMVFEDTYTRWTTSTFGTQSATTNALAATPVSTGTRSLHLASTSSTYGETGVWTTRGPNLRSGDIIMKFKINPARIDPGSGAYVSVSIGGDRNVVKNPKGYTTAGGAVSPGKTTVLVWQLGLPRTPATDPNARVLTQDLGPITLNQWSSYTINVTQALAAIPAADRPLDYDGLTYVRMAVAGKAGTADAYFDSFSIDSTTPQPPADEFVSRTPLVGAYDTPTFKFFPSYEMGQSKHSQRFNFGITQPSQYVSYTNGIDGIRPTQDSGYPAQLNHPGTGTTIPEAIAGKGLGADFLEVREPAWSGAWDEILKQGTQIVGTYSSDTHSGVSANSDASFLYAPALAFDDLLHSYYEGRTYSAVSNFGGRLLFNTDATSTEPFPARYPIQVSDSESTGSAHFAVTGGLLTGYKVRWIRNGVVLATDTPTGTSYDQTKPIDLTGPVTYVRAEVLNSSGGVVGVTQPIFFRDVVGLPAGTSYAVDKITTADNRGYNRIMTQGVTASSYDAPTKRLSMTVIDPPAALALLAVRTTTAASAVTVGGTAVPKAASAAEFDAATGSTWFHDSVSGVLNIKVRHAAGTTVTDTAAVVVDLSAAAAGDTTAPSAPSGLSATAASATSVNLSWTAAVDDVGVTGYDVWRNGAALASSAGTGTTFTDSTAAASTTYSYTVRARDAAGNVSPESAPATATTPAAADTTPPTAPTGLTAAAASATSVNLSWTASTDNVGVTAYRVVRDGATVATVGAVTGYTDTTVAASTTYSYTVQALDGTGNASAPSNAAPVTTPAAGGGSTVTVTADADAKVQAANPTTNYAAANLVVDGAPDPEKHVYLRFPVTGLTGPVTSAKLRVHVSNGTNNGPGVFAAATTTWTETGLTWATRPGPTGAVLENKAALATGASVDYDVTALVTGNGTYAMVLLPESNDDFIIDSREKTTPADRPQLVITTG
jgi:chitodextrinase